MKKLLTITLIFLLSLLILQKLFSNDLFIYDHTKKVELGDFIENKLVELIPINGKTYTLNHNLSVITSTNGTITCVLPHRIILQQNELSSAYFNNTPIKYLNDFKLPEVLKIQESQFNFSAQGEFYVVSENNKQHIIATGMSLIVFEKAAFFVKAGDKFTHVYLLSGNVTVIDNKSSKKKKELKVGDYLVVTPQASLSPKEASLRSLGSSFSIKEVEDIEKEAHLSEIKTLQTKLDNVIFVNYNTNIFGVKLN
jgi:hypothetical protein